MADNGQRVAIEYTLTLDDGSTVDTNVGQDPLVYEHGAQQILPALESAIAPLATGDAADVTLTPEEGYGPFNPEAVVNVPKESIPEHLQAVGTPLQLQDEDRRPLSCRVIEIQTDEIVLDFNHPLAGETLHFAVKVVAID